MGLFRPDGFSTLRETLKVPRGGPVIVRWREVWDESEARRTEEAGPFVLTRPREDFEGQTPTRNLSPVRFLHRVSVLRLFVLVS